MGQVNTRLQRDLTRRTRVQRRYSLKEVAAFLGIDYDYLVSLIGKDGFPAGERSGRERVLSIEQMLQVRAMLAARPQKTKNYLPWRSPLDPLPVLTVSGQKGGTGKSSIAAHLAQYLCLAHGLRVGLIDSDPQATLSLYFADSSLQLFDPELETVADFMGVEDPARGTVARRTPEELDAYWQDTPWPGIRLMPGGPSINEGDIALFMVAKSDPASVYKSLYRALRRWSDGHRPRTSAADFIVDGEFNLERWREGLRETFDVIVIDQQPSLTLMQLNGIVAADTLILPQTMKGFDLSTLTTYVTAAYGFLRHIAEVDEDLVIGSGRDVVVPSIVQTSNAQDYRQIQDLIEQSPDDILKVWYERSDAVANASEVYQSIYEFQPGKNTRKSAKRFMANANAVNDALAARALPHLESRGFAEAFMAEKWEEDAADETEDDETGRGGGIDKTRVA
jgi:chromosome partitioning protein